MTDKERLESLLQRRDRLRESVQRIKGRLDSARKEQETVEAECRSKGVPPEKLAATIEQVSKRFDTAVTDLESKMTAAESNLKPYEKE